MSWFNASQLSSFAKQALSQAQKSIDRVLDIQEEEPSAWAETIPYGQPGISPPVSGGWDSSTWGLKSNTEPQSQPVTSPKAITKPVRRTVVDESENFFSAFLSSADVQTIQKSPVVSKPPAKSQRPEEEVKSTLQESLHTGQSRTAETTESKVKDSPLPVSGETLAADALPPETEGKHEETVNKELDPKVSTVCLKVSESVINVKTTRENVSNMSTQPLTAETKDMALEPKEQKHEDRQSNTPSPPVSTFSSGTSTTSDIEVLDHESVISESSASSRQETADSKSSLHLMQTSFQLLSASACPEYNRLDDFPKLTESCCSSDAFERIDSFSVQSLDSRSVSEINSDDELSGKGYALVPIIVNPLTPKTKTVESVEGKPEEEVNGTLIMPTEETELEESGRSATPVNCEQPDILVSSTPVNEGHAVLDAVGEQGEAADSHPEALSEKEDMCKTVEFLNEKLDKREAQLLSLSKEKALLEEAYDNLKDEMFRVKEESSSISSLKDEFTQRIAEAEKKAQLACKERDATKKEIKSIKEELATRLNSSETADLLKEKDEQIQGLMEEGEKLSKQQLHNSNIIKKLRAKDKENENIIAKLNKKVKELEEELQHLKQVLDGKEEVEKQHRENIKKLNSVVERQEKDLGRLQVDMNELEEKNRSIQAALDSAYKELTDLHKANAAKDSEAQEAALSREMRAKEELSAALEKAQEDARQQQETLAIQVGDLRLALQRAEQAAARKEDYLRHEISELQQRLQEAENRNQELSQSVSSTTRPLLRQIENLQATLGSQTSSWEKLEKNLSDRLGESQALLAAAVERERAATEELLANKIQVSSMESQNSLLRQENSRFQAQLESEKSRLRRLEDENNRYQVELENLKDEYVRTLEETRKEKMLLNSQLEMEKMKVEQERKKAIFTQEAIKEKERKPFSVSSTPTMSRSSSISGVDMVGLQTSFLSQDEPHDHSFGPMSVSANGSNLYDAVRMGAGSSIIENLQSQLKLKEGEITHLQLEIGSLEKTRSIMAEELVKLTNQNDELEEKVKEIPKLRTQLRDLDQRYNTILQMYGEKAEEAEELRLDLEDVKNMYKTQIDELLRQRLS
ncbi:TATA element modulatory factor isoform X1 [Camelus ferus]|uniref:TATA element modulatory factor isoform X1 n=2 Tax=Camelus TaxID=9836 RepID=A0A8B8RAH7_CAMFR|nr:TATA element modulatory factor isoform X1 [Camelus bactrianus]XP_032313999.1 TATA element modulatory factor isoform X1 [Camelus ferus]